MNLRLAAWVDALGPDRWAAAVLDAEDRLAWVSPELKAFIGEDDDEALGVGAHVVHALTRETWMRTMAPDSQVRMFQQGFPFFVESLGPRDPLPEPFESLVAGVQPQPQPPVWSFWFDYIEDDLPAYRVELVMFLLRDEAGAKIGTLILTNRGLRPTLLSLLGRGDEAMHERMARLIKPGRHATAILFADLEGSGELSRQLSTSGFFRLVRDLTTAFDAAVADECGIVGKHAGDGMTAFILVDDVGTPSRAAAAAVTVARRLHRAAEQAREGLAVDGFSNLPPVLFNVGLHWGSGVFLGQLVPGGRLDVTALGDEVNECSRIEQSARGGRILASKALLELLDKDEADRVGIDPARVRYRPLSALPEASAKAIRDAGNLAVAEVPSGASVVAPADASVT
jgi:class 3 adenylate cyclase